VCAAAEGESVTLSRLLDDQGQSLLSVLLYSMTYSLLLISFLGAS
jgi:hypothetical protein